MTEPEAREEALGDLLGDLLHLVGPETFNRCLERGRTYYEEELAEEYAEPEGGPPESEHIRGCQAMQGVQLPCNCDGPGTVDGIAGDAPCTVCGRDNRHGTHTALEGSHLNHEYAP